MTRFGAVEAGLQPTHKPLTTLFNTTFHFMRIVLSSPILTYRTTFDRPPTVQVAASIFQELCYANKEHISAGLIIAGYDDHDGPAVYHIPAGGSLHKQEFSIGGSGSTYIYGFCDSNFRENMTKEEGVEFVKNGVTPFTTG
jgi:20S proteasome subunit beta 1